MFILIVGADPPGSDDQDEHRSEKETISARLDDGAVSLLRLRRGPARRALPVISGGRRGDDHPAGGLADDVLRDVSHVALQRTAPPAEARAAADQRRLLRAE